MVVMIFTIFHEDVRLYLYSPSCALREEHLRGLKTCKPSSDSRNRMFSLAQVSTFDYPFLEFSI